MRPATIPSTALPPSDTTAAAIQPQTMIPDLLRARPHLRDVFDRYGLRGCGGAHGPAETLAYFARAHGVELERLLSELRQADRTVPHPAAAHARGGVAPRPLPVHFADTIYRPFFKTAIAIALSAGAVWGAYLLIRIALAGSFTAISIHDINAHGHAQIFGWVGLFVMGFAYQAFPRMRHTTLWRPGLALFTFYLMLAGIVARTLGEPLYAVPGMRVLALAGATSEAIAIALFALVITRTIQASGHALTWTDGYVFAAIAFFLLQAGYEWGLLLATTGAATRADLLELVATWQAPLRDIQIHGFALLMILGVGLRMFPALFDFPARSPRLVRNCLFLLLAAVAGEVAFFLAMRLTGQSAWAAPLYLSMLVLAGACVALTYRWLPCVPAGRSGESPTSPPDRSVKFLRASMLWLHLSLLLLLLAPLYMLVLLPQSPWLSSSGAHSAEIHFSHAYYGAIRHAITVGFISLMILAMAAKVVPTLNGVDLRLLRPLWLPFILVNLGCALRVSLQIATDFAAVAYPLVGISGVLEVSGIAIWGVHLWRIMNGWQPAAAPDAGPIHDISASPVPRITADDSPGRVVERFPATLPVLLQHGLTPLAKPLLRRTLGRSITIRTAAAMRGISLEAMLAALNQSIQAPPGSRPNTQIPSGTQAQSSAV